MKERHKKLTNLMKVWFYKSCKPAGQHGTISHQTTSSARMILICFKDLDKFVDNLNPAYTADLHTRLAVQVEYLHVMSHLTDQLQTTLQYSSNLANTVYESIKRVVSWVEKYLHLTHRIILLSNRHWRIFS